ncbi:TraR/DksA C4-type zinc finger protein [Hydrocarboniphaga effusa]|uniref:TraR/DksA C4-type zinc finger protein n=1 Tax=Hydrocarboniphaga effusa TaxID=243629 RepID=UPI003BA84524
MTDFFDRAAEEELRQREDALARHQAVTQVQGTEFCEDCGNGIPAARRAAYPAAIRCVPCQTAEERRASHSRAKSR